MKTPKAILLPSGNWNVRMRIKGNEYSITRPSAEEAVAEAMAIRAGLKQPGPTQKSITLGYAMDVYIESRKHVLSASTIRSYKSVRRCRFQSAMGMSITHMTKAQWQSLINLEARGGLSAKTMKNVWGLVSAVLKDNGLTVPDVRLPSVMPNEHPYLTPDQIEVFIRAIRDKPVELSALFGLHGLRRSEICGLTWEDIDLKNKIIHIKGAVVFDSNQRQVRKKQAKNASSVRDVPILIDRLADLLARGAGKTGRIVEEHPNTIYMRVNKLCKENGLPLVGAHGLRHSFASLCQSKGIPEETTMLLGGWSDFQTMRRRYTHFSQTEVRSHVDSLKAFFSGTGNNNADKNDDENK